MAVGDSYGAGFEYAPPDFTKANNDLKAYRPHPKGTIRAGCYTDDTQEALGNAELLLSGEALTTRNLARYMLAVFKRDPRQGYAQGFYDLLTKCKTWMDLVRRLQPHSNKSGGAMRAAPYGMLPDVQDVIDRAMWQASLTHATRNGMTAAAGAALLVYGCRCNCDTGYLPSYLNDLLPGFAFDVEWVGRVGSPGLDAVRAAVTAIESFPPSMSAILHRCVAYTGDVDTVAAIALAAASQHPGIAQDLPQVLIDGLENGPYGRDYLAQMDAALEAKYPLA